MPFTKVLHLPVVLLALTACTGEDPDSPGDAGSARPTASTSSSDAREGGESSEATRSGTPSESPSADPAVLPTGQVCGDLDLSGVERSAGGPVEIGFDIGAGEAPPYGGPATEASACELTAPKGTLNLNFTPLEDAEQSEDGARRFLEKGSTAMESLDYTCAPIASRTHDGRSAFEVQCTTPNDTAIVAYHVLMGTFMASCTAFDVPASDAALAGELATALCTSYTDSL